MTLIEKINLLLAGLTVVCGSIGGLIAVLTRVVHLMHELRHELNGKLDEMKQQTLELGRSQGADVEREKSRLIAKDLIRDTAAQVQREAIVHTDDLGP